jgi:hypothetical protein
MFMFLVFIKLVKSDCQKLVVGSPLDKYRYFFKVVLCRLNPFIRLVFP